MHLALLSDPNKGMERTVLYFFLLLCHWSSWAPHEIWKKIKRSTFAMKWKEKHDNATDWLISWLADLLTDSLENWFIDWVIDRMVNGWSTRSLIIWFFKPVFQSRKDTMTAINWNIKNCFLNLNLKLYWLCQKKFVCETAN